MDETTQAASRFKELSPRVQELLSGLNTDEVATLEYIATIPRDEVRGMMKTFRDLKAVSKFMQWLILSVVAIFIGTVALGESILKVFTWFKGGSP